MLLHYVEGIPLNAPVVVRERPVKRAPKKRSMQPSNLTFQSLLHAQIGRVNRGDGPSASSLPNLTSALKAFLHQQKLSMGSPVASTLRASFYKNLHSHVEALKAEGRSNDYISNRKGLLGQWRSCVILFDQACAAELKTATPFQIGIQDVFSKVPSQKGLARDSGVPLATLKRWSVGGLPNGTSIGHVTKLERHLGLVSGALTSLLPEDFQHRRGIRTQETTVPIEYRVRLAQSNKIQYILKDANARLRNEWAEYVRYKVGDVSIVEALTDDDDDEREETGLERQSRSRWSTLKSSHDASREAKWYELHNGQYVPTASLAWQRAAAFIGWLMLRKEQGGMELSPEDAQTLANLHRRSLVRAYVDWQVQRADGIVHEGILTFLVWVKALCNPRTGYLTQRGRHLAGHSDDESESKWRRRCEATYVATRALREEFLKKKSPSRDPMEPIESVLALPNPLEAIADMVLRMGAARPNTNGKREAVWARDILFVKLLASNPLRIKNMRWLTYQTNNKGHLRQDSTGAWSIYVPKNELKNHDGAAKDKDYHMPVRPEVWRDIEQYLKHYRPMLAAQDTDIIFVSEGKQFSRNGLGKRFEMLTRLYLQGCPGVGPHAMRHIVATSILKSNPNDWAGAAMALHDKEETVRSHYAHLAQSDAARWLDKTLAGPFSRM